MPRHANPLPADLPGRFSVREARARGVSAGRLDRGDLRAPYHGVRATAKTPAPATLTDRCREYAPRLKDWQFFSHETALQLLGAPMPGWPYLPKIHVAAHRPAREPRTQGAVGHRLQLREPATRFALDDLRVEHPVRAWRQCGTLWRLDDLIAAGDFLVSGESPLASVDELRTEIEVMGDIRNILRRALTDIRVGPRSPRETRLRLVLVRAGLPEPEVTWVLRDGSGGFVAELDLAYPRWRIAAEYDGRVHAEDATQFAKDADRWDRIRAEGWDHVRILSHHLAGTGVVAVRKVRNALIRAGWQPGL
ncbi:hypothetical protein [Microbacterium pumilum]